MKQCQASGHQVLCVVQDLCTQLSVLSDDGQVFMGIHNGAIGVIGCGSNPELSGNVNENGTVRNSLVKC